MQHGRLSTNLPHRSLISLQTVFGPNTEQNGMGSGISDYLTAWVYTDVPDFHPNQEETVCVTFKSENSSNENAARPILVVIFNAAC